MKVESLNKMGLQEIVDYAVKKIVEQGGRCLNGLGNCAYGDYEGNHCAVGWLLDEDNNSHMCATGGVGNLINAHEHDPYFPRVFKENKYLFQELQRFHDAKFICKRILARGSLAKYDIDTSGKHFQQWVNMGEG